ncbi:MAG: protein phosphatase 2C domain-containing protein [Burkholderiaceae bacterium]|nr:protein phosphatase 2C domain-containing protein [Burkholderiaceae bacterium]
MKNGYRLRAAVGLHRGDREQQQDQVILLRHPYASDCMMGVVADGMGGRTGGRRASDQVILTARQLFEHYLPAADDPEDLLRQIAQQAHALIRLTAVTTEQEPHSTFAAFLVNPGGQCVCAHSGDSRIYHFHGSTLIKRTLDHSYVQMLVDQGHLSEQEAAAHPQSNVLISCLGMEQEPQLDLHRISRLRAGDSLLACSDGLWHYFTADELGMVISSMPPRDASEMLIRQARQRAMGNGDNLSLAIVRINRPAPNQIAPGAEFAPLQ